MPGVNSLRFSDVYAATGQRRRLAAGWSGDDFFAHLRLDTLLGRELVVPDTYILDGAYFLDSSPKDLAARLGRGVSNRALPLVVRTRKGTLKDSLRMLVVRDERDQTASLNGFPFQSIQDERARNALADALAQCSTGEYMKRVGSADNVPKALADFLRQLLATKDAKADLDLEIMETGWSAWIAAETVPKQRRLKVQEWDAQVFDLKAVANDKAYEVNIDEFATNVGRELYRGTQKFIQDGETLRSRMALRALFAQANAKTDSEKSDVATVQSWYDHVRHRAMARQHRCTAFAHTLRSEARPIGPLQRRLRRVIDTGERSTDELTVPEDFYAQLACIDNEQYSRSLLEHMPQLDGWWTTGDIDGLKETVEGLLKLGGPSTKPKSEGLVELLGEVVDEAAKDVPFGKAFKVLVTRGARGGIRKEAAQRVVEYLRVGHAAYAP
ncbi:MAG: hypothetical protein V4844_02945 [Pseudomonadota bacterium]